MHIFSEYIHIQIVRQEEDYFENTKRTLYTYFIGISFMFHRMQSNTKIVGQKTVLIRNNDRQNINQNHHP